MKNDYENINAKQTATANSHQAATRNWLVMIGLLLAVFLGQSMTANAAIYTVTNPNDSGAGSLRQAILDANASAEDDTINFNLSGCPCTITLTSGELSIANNGALTINGSANGVSVSGNNASRVFYIQESANVTIDSIIVKNGNGIGTVAAYNGHGGGIFAIIGSTMTLSNLTVIGNSATQRGGGIQTYGNTMTLTNSTVSGNSTIGTGGGFYSFSGLVTINNSTITGNSANYSAGGVSNNGTMTLTNSTITGNTAGEGGGGGIANTGGGGILTLTSSTVSNNLTPTFCGGGIVNFDGGTVTLTNSTVSGNSSPSHSGGGIYNYSGTATLTNSTVSGNSANYGGGIYNLATLMLTNSTVSGNSASQVGGGIANYSDVTEATMSLNNTIIANSNFGGDCVLLSGTINASYSLIEEGVGCVNGINSNNLTGDPNLGPLQNNGGATFTHALLAYSPAINFGSNALAVDAMGNPLATDQRGAGFQRIRSSNVDMGAIESPSAIYLVDTITANPSLTACTAAANDCSISGAIANVNAASGESDAINFDPTVFGTPQTITLTGGALIIANNKTLTINGTGADRLTISGNNASRVFNINTGANVGINNLTISNGKMINDFGGGIYNGGTLTLSNTTISGNSARSGGGIYNDGSISTASGTLTLINSTVSGNSTTNSGGGIFTASGIVRLTNSTVSGNSATYSGGGVYNDYGTVTLNNSIIANSTTGGDCSGSPVAASYSLIEDGTCGINNGANGNKTGDPNLGPLQNNGGTTKTHALLADSIAIDAGSNALIPSGIIADQRGSFRIDDGDNNGSVIVDMGSFEVQGVAVTNTNDSGAGSLRWVIANANASPDDNIIYFDLTIFGTPQTITLRSGELTIANNGKLTINGTGADRLTISGNNASRVFNINTGANVGINNLTISNGKMINDFGGGIYNGGTLTLSNTIISGNSARSGGGIFSDSTMTLINSTVSGNSAEYGGGIFNYSGLVTLTNSTVSSNSATELGGGIENLSTLMLTGSTVSGNTAMDTDVEGFNGGGGGGIDSYNGALKIKNSTISGNQVTSAGGDNGGGIWTNNTATITNTTITDNSVGGTTSASGIFRSGSDGTVTLSNTIVAANVNNLTVPDVGGSFTSNGYNLIGNVGAVMAFNQMGDQTGTNIAPLDPRLTPLGNYGGTTETHQLLPGSPAIDTGNSDLMTDQRGVMRPIDDSASPNGTGNLSDIGAFELETAQVIDTTPPVIAPNVSGTLGTNGWYVSDVTVSWSVTDAESTVSSQNGCAMQTVSAETGGITFTCTATSDGGTDSQSVTVKRDATAPTLAPTVAPNPVLLSGAATASANASDALSGIASESCNAVDTSSVGSKTVNCSATDNAGNTANASANYQVIYNFAGFFSPVSNLPAVNQANAGQSIPIKFSLSGYKGLNILAAGSPSLVACDVSEPGSTVDETVTAGSSGLSYDGATDQYSYIWKTSKSWKGTCRILSIKFIDGTEQVAKFRFK